MIISHKHKFIFLKPQKTAGTSIELMLSRVCGDEDIITPLGFDPEPDVRKKNNAKAPQNYYRPKPLKNWEIREVYWLMRGGKKPNLNYWEHLDATKIKEYAGNEVWENYLKISIVRNPWDRAVSWYKWQAKYGFEGTEDGNFKKYIIENYRSAWPFYSVNLTYTIDFMIRFEHLESDLQQLCGLLPALDLHHIPLTKESVRREKTYEYLYKEPLLIDIVKERSLQVIERFNYDF